MLTFNNHSAKKIEGQNWHTWGTAGRKHFAFYTPKSDARTRWILSQRRNKAKTREMQYLSVQIAAPTETTR